MRVYTSILGTPGIAILLLTTLVGRLPIGINGLAVLLYVREISGSYAVAGLVTGALALGSALGAPLQGRLVDRRGERMLIPLASGHAAGLLLLWALGSVAAPTGALAGAALLAGAGVPPTSSVLRARWPYLLAERPELIKGAFALDSVMIEVIFVTGPLLTAVIVATVGAEVALAVSAACALGGTGAFVLALAGRPGPEPDRSRRALGLGALASPGLRTLVVATLPVGFCLGSIEVALPAFSEAVGDRAFAGVLLATWSAASGVAGLLYGARPQRLPLTRVHLWLAALLPLGCLPLVLASSPLSMAFLVILAGAPIAPLIASRNQLVGSVAPPGAAAEAFTWPLTALIAGLSLGVAVAGGLAEAEGWSAPVLAGAAVAAAGAALLTLHRRRLEPPVAVAPAPAR